MLGVENEVVSICLEECTARKENGGMRISVQHKKRQSDLLSRRSKKVETCVIFSYGFLAVTLLTFGLNIFFLMTLHILSRST